MAQPNRSLASLTTARPPRSCTGATFAAPGFRPLLAWTATALVFGLVGCVDPISHPLANSEPVRAPGRVTTFAGTGTRGFDGDGHATLESDLNQPTEVGFDGDGLLYVIDWNNHRVRHVGWDGTFATLIGSNLPGDWPAGTPLDAKVTGTSCHINHPMDVAFDASGNAIVAAWHNHKLLDLDPHTDTVTVIAGGNKPGYGADGSAAAGALLNFPDSLVIDPSGAILFADERNHVIRRIDPAGARTITTVAGVKGMPGYLGDGGPAASAHFTLAPTDEPTGSDNPPPGGGLALDAQHNLYVADTYNHCVRRIAAGADGAVGTAGATDETIETVAGQCGAPGPGVDGDASSIHLDQPRDIEIEDGALYIADSGNHLIWRVDLGTHAARHWVGTGVAGDGPEGNLPLATMLNAPYGITFDASGNLFIADTLNNRIRVLWK